MGRVAAVLLIVVAVIAQAACGRSVTRRADPDATPAATTTRTPTPTPGPLGTPEALSGSTNGTLVLQLFDDAGGDPVGIPVAFGGPTTKTLTTDASGKIRFTARPGTYSARVLKGCHARVFVELGGTAQFRLIGARVTTGRVRAVWRHRYGPGSAPASASLTGDWPVGERVEVTYGAADRCTEKRAPSVSFPSFAFETSRNLKIVETPRLSSDGEGLAKVVVSCTAPGDISLVVVDKLNPADKLDLDALLIGYGGDQRCGS